MAALATSTRFNPAGVRKVYWLDTIADAGLAYTTVERTAGLDVTDEVAGYTGWTLEASSVATPAQGSRFTSSVPGRTSVQDSSITFWASQDGTDIRDEVAIDDEGYVIFEDGGATAGYKAEVFPARVMSIGAVRSVDDGAFQVTVSFAVTAEPKTVDVPTAA